MEWLLLAGSAGLLIFCSHRVAGRFARGAAEHFFIVIAAAALQLGAIALGLSIFRAITPIHWIAAQALFVLPIAWAIARVRGRVRGREPRSHEVTKRDHEEETEIPSSSFVAPLVPSRLRGSPAGPRRPPMRIVGRIVGFAKSSRRAALIVALVTLVLAMTLARQVLQPVANVDDRNYHASRAAYWMQHRSLLPWETHNDRQTVLPLGGELIYFWPTLFTRAEAPGLLTFWLAYPLSAAAVFAIIRKLGHPPIVAASGALILCFTPMVLIFTRGLSPETWMMFFVLGCGFWLVRAIREPSATALVFMGVYAGLAVNARATALPVLLLAPLAPLLAAGTGPAARAGVARAAAWVAAGAALALLLGGSVVAYGNNLLKHGNPLGPQSFRAVHMSDLSVRQVRTHAARALVTLLEPPAAPGAASRAALAAAYARLLDLLDADEPLPVEDAPWPGPYRVVIKPIGENYGLPGLAWLPALGFALAAGARRRGTRDRQVFAMALLGAALFAAVLFRIRWMPGMGRFWIAPFALAVPVIMHVACGAAARWRGARWASIAALVVSVACAGAFVALDAAGSLANPPSAVWLDYPFFEPLAHVPDRSRILLIDGQDSADYPLFRPRGGFVNRVTSWGRRPFDADRMREVMRRDDVTHVIVRDDRSIAFHWWPPVATPPFVQWLNGLDAFREIPLPYTPHMRLFARRDVPDAAAN